MTLIELPPTNEARIERVAERLPELVDTAAAGGRPPGYFSVAIY